MAKKETNKKVQEKPKDDTSEVLNPQIVQVIEKRVMAEPERNITYSREQLNQIKEMYAKGSSDIEFANFILVSTRTGLDIFKKQIYLVPRYDSRLGKNIFTPQTGIDGFRSIAERTGVYAGNDDPEFSGEISEKPEKGATFSAPEKATVTVYKIVAGARCPFTATARWKEYYPGDKLGFMWRSKPHVMLGKCAEALALRKAFPNVGELYTSEEMAMADAQVIDIPKPDKINEMFEKAKTLIGKKTDPKVIAEDLKKIKTSEKYSDDQKKEIEEIANARIKEITPNTEETPKEENGK